MTETTQAPAPQAPTFAEKVAKSSQAGFVEYNEERCVLTVIFKSSPQFSYSYSDFSAQAWQELLAAESIGSYLIRNVTRVKDGMLPYQFVKTTRADGEPIPAQPEY